MVVKIMRWRPWPPLTWNPPVTSKKYEVTLWVRRLEGLGDGDWVHEGAGGFSVEIRWKGPPKIALSSFRKSVKRNCTREESIKNGPNDAVSVFWDEEFQGVCGLSVDRENVFHPWEISFTVLNGLNQGTKNKVPVVGTCVLNLAEFADKTEDKEFELNMPLALPGVASEHCPSLSVTLRLSELRTVQEPGALMQKPVVPLPSPPQAGETPLTEKDELSALKAGLRKVKIFTEYVSTRRAKKACREEMGSDGSGSAFPYDSDSLDEYEESNDRKEDSTIRKSFSYGPLPYANFAGGSFCSDTRINGVDKDWVYYSNRRSDVGSSRIEDSIPSISDPSILPNSKRSILPWRKRKLSFRSPKSKGEPLLKKDNGEEGGDDIDYDRRQLSSDESPSFGWHKMDEESNVHRSSVSEFGDDNFVVGCWELKEIKCRDEHMKLQTQVFFASIDQRSERAAGESACTALVAVVADWLQENHDLPIKSQLDSLIREGSSEWRKLCENETYRKRFPDKHFDLETVLQAKICPITVVPEKSFIGFFHPDGMDEGKFDFLQGAMSFENIWDEISRAGSGRGNCEPQVYIVSWNDHFFVLKVENEAYYIIDTLGERLHEGCNQAYILKFDENTSIHRLPSDSELSDEKPADNQLTSRVEPKAQRTNSKEDTAQSPQEKGSMDLIKTENEDALVCQGKESCKEYIKSFLAAIPLRELQADVKKGLVSPTLLHQRLQIEFHLTELVKAEDTGDEIVVASAPKVEERAAITEVAE